MFLVPLLLAYEGGLVAIGGPQGEGLRTGADTWLHWGLELFGLHHFYWTPVFIVVVLLGWSWARRRDRPRDLFGVCTGMAAESVIFGLGLCGVSRELGPMLDDIGIKLAYAAGPDPAVARVVTFVGAGIYEEVLFRLLLFSGLVWVLRLTEMPAVAAVGLAAAGSALLFSAAHHAGPHGEPFRGYTFVFRTVAGLYFTFLYQLRGFGVAVGAHACYDVVVGVMAG
jgi:membrane protease YdiL (CAAX protease family)